MVKFTLFGVPVTIHPWFWVATAMLGGAYHAKSQQDFLAMAVFMLISLVSILVHEFGHALVGRRLGGGYATIELVAMMGLAYNHGGRFTRWKRFWMLFAGPGAGFLFGFVILAVLALVFGPRDALGFFKVHVFGILDGFDDLSRKTLELMDERPLLYFLISNLLRFNFWWGFINLLPVLPLDGGQIMNLWVKPQRLVYQICIGTAAALVVYGLVTRQYYICMLFGYFGYTNYQSMTANRWR